MVALSSATLLLFFFLSSCFINVQASSSQPCIFECPPNLTPVPYPVPKPREPTIPSFCYDPSATKFTQCCERLDRCFADCGAKFESCYDKLFLCFHSTCTRNKMFFYLLFYLFILSSSFYLSLILNNKKLIFIIKN